MGRLCHPTLDYVQVRVSGCKNCYESVWSAVVKAKTVTNNLPILSVKWFGVLLNYGQRDQIDQYDKLLSSFKVGPTTFIS